MGISSSARRQLGLRRRFAWLFALALLLSAVPPLPVAAWDDPEPNTPIAFLRKDKIFTSPGGEPVTTVAYGPDGRLYVGTMFGSIFALTLNESRDVVATQEINTIANSPNFNDDGSPAPGVTGRLLLGLTFDPQSPPSQPIMYVAHSDPRLSYDPVDPSTHLDVNSGTITRLTGPNFSSNRLDVVTGLPRSRKNHGTNGVTFGPDGWLYIAQGGNTDLGAPHNTWGSLPEFYLSAAILRADVRTMSSTLDVTDVESASDLTPLQGDFEIFATGFRNAYDLVWRSDGQLYVNENGANVFQGTTPGPADGCPNGQAILPPEQPDLLVRVAQGMHAGHPNPARGQCIFRDGTIYNPDKAPDANYQTPLRSYTYGQGEVSMDGIAEYPSGAMAGNLISATFSGTELLVRVIFNANGTVTLARMDEYGKFNNPLDLAVDGDGVIYVAEYGLSGPAGISVLIPASIAVPELTLSSINPNAGPPAGGTSVTLTGTLFEAGASVTFDGIQATNVTVVNSTTITATTPAHATGTVNVTVTNPDSESATLVNGFAYTNSGGGASVVRVNAGGGSFSGATGQWSGDTGFSGGSFFSASQAIAGTTDDPLYQSERFGNFNYTFALENGQYLVNLKFAEIYWSNPGQRVFDVTINGQTVLDNFDILGEAARLTALDKSFNATVTNGTLTIGFTTVVNNAKVSAIEIISGETDTTPPTVLSTSPVNNATNVPVQSSITVNFSEPMNKPATEAAFSLNPSHTGSFSWNPASTSMTFTPLAAVGFLQPNKLYTAGVSTGAMDLAGNTLQANHGWTFTTGANDDTTPPTVNATNPTNNATNVAVNTSVSVTFSEAMNQAATQAAFSLNPSAAGSFSWNPTGTIMTFTPTSALAEGQLYSASVSTGATDSAGNPLAAAFNWTFTTVGADPEPPPSLNSINPVSGPTTGGTAVTLSGTNFVTGATVSFGGTAATNVVVVNSTTITATTPAHSAGAVNVVVTNPDTQNDTLTNGFTYTSTGGSSIVRVNAGGGSFSGATGQWSGDTGFSGGSYFSTTQAIAGTTDDPLYQSERYGNFNYSFNLANGSYTVNLKFAEIYWSNPGQRVFDVTINGQLVLDNFDILTQAARLTALDKSFNATVTNGTLTIGFTTVVNNAKVSAIEILSGSGSGDTTPPTVNATSPANNATGVALGADLSVTFSEPMNQAVTQAAFSLNPSVPGSFSWNGAGTIMTFNPTNNLAANQLYNATVSTAAQDLAGNALQTATSWSFTTGSAPDTTAPTVSSTSPANNATNVVTSTNVSVTFSEAMNQAVTQGAFSINPSVPGAFSWNGAGTVLTFNPTNNLAASQLYTVTISTAAKDLAGNALAAAFNLSFTTASAPDTTPPTVSSVSPTNNATNVAINTNISVTFSEAMNQAATQAAFSINPNVPGAFSWNGAGTVLTFNPTNDLSGNQLYALTVSTGASDLAGNALASAFNWSFTTQNTAPPAPTLGSVTPNSGSTAGSTSVTLSGTNFVTGATVSFGGTAATNVVVVNSTTITATTPAHSAGAVNVVVTNPDTQAATLTNGFTYVAPGGGSSLARVNTGGGTYSAGGVIWSGDTGFSGGSYFSTTQPIAGTTDDALYQSERYGTFSYSFNLANGSYTVNLKFAEIFWTAPGQRVFDVAINGQLVLDNFDILTQAARLTALDRNFPVTVTNGTLTIAFTRVVDNATVAAIEILSSSGGGDTTPPTVNATSPTNNATGVAVNTNVSVTFSEPMNQAVTQAAFSLNPSAPGSFSWNGAGTVLTFDPTGDLAADQLYNAAVSTAAQDLAGNALQTATSWSFTTVEDTGEPGLGQWTTLPPLPEPRAEVAVVEAGGLIYVLGGGSPSGLSNKVFVYDPDSETWDEAAPYPGPAVDHAGAAVVNGVIYLIGGLTSWPSAAVNTVYAYDPTSDSWSQKANLPRDRGAMGVAVLGGKIYAAGGLVDGGAAVTDLAVYDPQANSWTPLAPMLTARDHLTMEAANGKLYAMGGRAVTVTAPVTANEAYDPGSNTWQAQAPLPVARGGHGSAVLDGKIIIFGGEGNGGEPSGVFESTHEYDPAGNSWQELAPMITPRHGMDGAVLDGVVYVPGGGLTQGGSQSTTHEAFSMLTEQSVLFQTTLMFAFLIALMFWLRWLGRRATER